MKKPNSIFLISGAAVVTAVAQGFGGGAELSPEAWVLFTTPESMMREPASGDPWWYGNFPQSRQLTQGPVDLKAIAGQRLGLVVNALTPQVWDLLGKLNAEDLEVLAFKPTNSNVTLDDPAMERIIRFGGLKTLVFNGTAVSDAGLKELSALKSLERLSLASEDLDDEALENIAHCHALKGLKFVAGRQLAAGRLGVLTNLAGLEELYLGRFRGQRLVEDDELAVLAKLRSLHRLAYTGMSKGGLEQVASLPALRELEIFGLTFQEQEPLRCLSGLTNLERLELAAFPAQDETLEMLSGLRQLKHLRLSPPCIDAARSFTDSGLAQLEKLPLLESIYISSSGVFTDKGLASLRGLPNLKQVALPNMSCELTDEGRIILNTCTQHVHLLVKELISVPPEHGRR